MLQRPMVLAELSWLLSVFKANRFRRQFSGGKVELKLREPLEYHGVNLGNCSMYLRLHEKMYNTAQLSPY